MKKWLPVKFSFISLRHVFPASFVRTFHERCACSWLYGKEFTFHTSFNQNQRQRVAEKKTMAGRRITSKAMGFSRSIKWKKKWWCFGTWSPASTWLFRYIFDVRNTTQRNCIRASYSLYLNTNERWSSTTVKCIMLLWMLSKILHGWIITKSTICLMDCTLFSASILHEVKVSQIHFCIVIISV